MPALLWARGCYAYFFLLSLSFFFFFRAIPAACEVPRLGVTQSCSCWPTPHSQQQQIQAASATYTATYGNTGSSIHWARPGMERKLRQVLNLLSHSGNGSPLFKREGLFIYLLAVFLLLFFGDFLFVCLFLGLHSRHREVPRLGSCQATPQPQQWGNPSLVCDLHHSSQQCWIPNLLSEGGQGSNLRPHGH